MHHRHSHPNRQCTGRDPPRDGPEWKSYYYGRYLIQSIRSYLFLLLESSLTSLLKEERGKEREGGRQVNSTQTRFFVPLLSPSQLLPSTQEYFFY